MRATTFMVQLFGFLPQKRAKFDPAMRPGFLPSEPGELMPIPPAKFNVLEMSFLVTMWPSRLMRAV